MNFGKKLWNSSIVFKLTAPILIVSAIILASVYYLISFHSKKLENILARNISESIEEALTISAEIDSSTANLRRLINTLSINKEIDYMFLLDRDSNIIIAASQNAYIGSDISKLDNIIPNIHSLADHPPNEIKTNQNEGNFFTHSAINIYNHETRSIKKLQLIIRLNETNLRPETSNSLSIILWCFFISIIILTLIVIFVQRIVLLKPLINLQRLIHDEITNQFVGVHWDKGDLLMRVTAMFQDVMWAKSHSDKETERMLKIANRNNESRQVFIANMSHELRTPLNSIIGFSGRLLKSSSNFKERQQSALISIHENGHYLLTLVNDILDLSKIDDGKMELHYHEFSISEKLITISNELNNLAETKGLEFKKTIQSDVSAKLDEKRFKQIIYNLLSNAIKYTEKGYVELTSQKVDDDNIVVSIKDTGIGIKETDKKRLFKRFEQFDADSNQNVGRGTGLGLSITKDLIKLMKGKIVVTSTYGEGSEFTITLPLNSNKKAH